MFFEDLFLLKNLIADEIQPTFTLIAIHMNFFFSLIFGRDSTWTVEFFSPTEKCMK